MNTHSGASGIRLVTSRSNECQPEHALVSLNQSSGRFELAIGRVFPKIRWSQFDCQPQANQDQRNMQMTDLLTSNLILMTTDGPVHPSCVFSSDTSVELITVHAARLQLDAIYCCPSSFNAFWDIRFDCLHGGDTEPAGRWSGRSPPADRQCLTCRDSVAFDDNLIAFCGTPCFIGKANGGRRAYQSLAPRGHR